MKAVKSYSEEDFAAMTPAEVRSIIRRGEWTEGTSTMCRGYGLTNLTVVPKDMAFEFLLFCNRNSSCTVSEVVEQGGDPITRVLAEGADVRTDLPRYRVYKDGKLIDEPTDVIKYWRDDLVAFLIGGSCGFDWALKDANIQYRFPGAYTSDLPAVPAGRFYGHNVVTCRIFRTSRDAVRAVQISSRHLAFHGPPIYIGDYRGIKIKDFANPDAFIGGGETIPPEPSEIALYWGCGITPQLVAIEAKVPFMITHYPGHMFVTDRRVEELAVF